MKVFIAGEIFDTGKTNVSDIKWKLQRRLFQWLGLTPDGEFNFKVDSVAMINPNKIELKFSRHYGSYYDTAFTHEDCIFSYDKQILLGDGYQTGCNADFSKHPGRYVIRYHIDGFLDDYKQTVKGLHCSRMKKISISEIPDQITITYETYGRKKKEDSQTIQN